jgi:4'-phosphopantetheinyl transferase EntD
MRELESGRVYAKRALAMMGIKDVDLPIAPDRSPLWPAGIVGSLTHLTGRGAWQFAAAIARTTDLCAIGIDIEREVGLHPRLWNYILTQHELTRILAMPLHIRATEVQVAWCAKEALIKAVRKRIEPTDVDIERDPSSIDFVAIWRVPGPEKRPVEIWRGRIARSQGLILAAVARAATPRQTDSFPRNGIKDMRSFAWRRAEADL